jgi:hypothetical protein
MVKSAENRMRSNLELLPVIVGSLVVLEREVRVRRNCNIFNQEVDAHLFMFLSSPKQTKCTLENDVIHHCKMKRSFLVAHDFVILVTLHLCLLLIPDPYH